MIGKIKSRLQELSGHVHRAKMCSVFLDQYLNRLKTFELPPKFSPPDECTINPQSTQNFSPPILRQPKVCSRCFRVHNEHGDLCFNCLEEDYSQAESSHSQEIDARNAELHSC